MFLSYTRLKHEFVTMCSPFINDTNFFALKNLYEQDLNSTRRMSYCENLEQLINLLEKADIVNKDNVVPLRQIVLQIGSQDLTEVLNYLNFYENQPSKEHRHFAARTYTNYNFNQSNPINHNSLNNIQRLPPITVTPSAPVPPNPQIQLNMRPNPQIDVQRDVCFKILAESLGNRWKTVGRYLDVREGIMDNIHKKHKNDMSAQILEMLHTFEENPMYERRILRTRLTKALRMAKREDLARDVEDVFDRYPNN